MSLLFFQQNILYLDILSDAPNLAASTGRRMPSALQAPQSMPRATNHPHPTGAQMAVAASMRAKSHKTVVFRHHLAEIDCFGTHDGPLLRVLFHRTSQTWRYATPQSATHRSGGHTGLQICQNRHFPPSGGGFLPFW